MDQTRTLTGGRSYVLTVPDALDRTAPPTLVLVASGGGWDVARMRAETRLDGRGLVLAWLVTAPRGLVPERLSWAAGAGCCGSAERDGVDDVGYVADVIADAAAHLGPLERVVAIGASNGGIFVYTLAAAGLVQAVGVVAGCRLHALPPGVQVVHLHGDADTAVPWAGGPVREGGGYECRPILDEVRELAPAGLAAREPRGARVWSYVGPGVALHRVRGGGHRWFPEATEILCAELGLTGAQAARAA